MIGLKCVVDNGKRRHLSLGYDRSLSEQHSASDQSIANSLDMVRSLKAFFLCCFSGHALTYENGLLR